MNKGDVILTDKVRKRVLVMGRLLAGHACDCYLASADRLRFSDHCLQLEA